MNANVKNALLAADLALCTATVASALADADPMRASVDAYVAAGLDDFEVTDAEIAEMGEECGLAPMAWVERLEAFTARARAELLAAA